MMVLKFIDFDIDGINMKDMPDFVDAYVCGATAVLEDGTMRDATEEELEELTRDGDLMQDLIHEFFY